MNSSRQSKTAPDRAGGAAGHVPARTESSESCMRSAPASGSALQHPRHRYGNFSSVTGSVLVMLNVHKGQQRLGSEHDQEEELTRRQPSGLSPQPTHVTRRIDGA